MPDKTKHLPSEDLHALNFIVTLNPLGSHGVCTTPETLRSFVPKPDFIHILFEAGTWPWRSLWYGNKPVSFSTLPAWPNGYGVPLLRVRLWVRVPSWVLRKENAPLLSLISIPFCLFALSQFFLPYKMTVPAAPRSCCPHFFLPCRLAFFTPLILPLSASGRLALAGGLRVADRIAQDSLFTSFTSEI